MVKGELKSGFKFELDDEAMDDIEFVELLADAETSVTPIPKIATIALGKEQYKKLKDHLRNENGRVPVSVINEALSEMFENADAEIKNSEPSPE